MSDVSLCIAGCNHFAARESSHHRDCPYYGESLTKWSDEKIQSLEEKIKLLVLENKKLNSDVIELVELGTDQVVTEKILKLESELAKEREIVDRIEDGKTGYFELKIRARQRIKERDENNQSN